MSWSWVPCSATRPASGTAIDDVRRTVENRCEMTTVVHRLAEQSAGIIERSIVPAQLLHA
jgi:hypothetical protein